jgi:hydroxymethylglutaryl-CoA lyase
MTGKLELPQKVSITDITMRDGIQSEQRFIPTQAKLHIINNLIDAGIKEMEVTAFAPPKYQPQFRDWEQVLGSLPQRDDVTYSCVAMGKKATERAFDAKDKGYRVDRILIAVLPASERMNKLVLGMDYSETWQWVKNIVQQAKERNIKINGVLTGIFSPPPKEEAGINMMDKALEFAERLLEIGVDDLEHPDHLGEATPDKSYEYFSRVMEKFPDPKLHVFHIHDSRGLGLACYFAALQTGIRRFEATMGGLGGWPANFIDGVPVPGLKGLVEVSRRSGLVSTEDLVVMLEGMGIETGVDVDKIMDLGRIVEKIMDRELWSLTLGTGSRPGSGKVPREVQDELKTEGK